VAMRTKVLMATRGLKGTHVFLGKRMLGVVQEKQYAVEIDSADDFVLAEFYLDKFIKTKRDKA